MPRPWSGRWSGAHAPLGLRTDGPSGRHGAVTWTLPEPMLAAPVSDPALLPGWAGEPKLWTGFDPVRCPRPALVSPPQGGASQTPSMSRGRRVRADGDGPAWHGAAGRVGRGAVPRGLAEERRVRCGVGNDSPGRALVPALPTTWLPREDPLQNKVPGKCRRSPARAVITAAAMGSGNREARGGVPS